MKTEEQSSTSKEIPKTKTGLLDKYEKDSEPKRDNE